MGYACQQKNLSILRNKSISRGWEKSSDLKNNHKAGVVHPRTLGLGTSMNVDFLVEGKVR